MSMDPGCPRTPKFFKRFEIFFGRLFLAIGAAALLMAAVLFLVLRDEPGMGSRIWAFLISPLTLGVIFLAVGASYLRRGLRQARKEERPLQVGTTTEATVTSIEPTNTRVNRHPLWRVRYAFDDLHGTPREGQSSNLSEAEAQSYQIGEQIFIRYDPEQPSESIWLGRVELMEQV
jgi:hypothetical protein